MSLSRTSCGCSAHDGDRDADHERGGVQPSRSFVSLLLPNVHQKCTSVPGGSPHGAGSGNKHGERTMATLSQDVVVGQLLAVLREALDGPAQFAYFADEGLSRTLAGISAADASRSVGGSSIAAHVHHVVFGFAASAAWIRGDRS